MNTFVGPYPESTPSFEKKELDVTRRNIQGNPTGYQTLYPSAAAEVNRRYFKVRVPQYALINPVEEPETEEFISYASGMKVKHTVRHTTMLPATFYQTVTPDQMVNTVLTLAKIIDLYHSKEKFQITDEVEQIQIFLLLDAYLEEIKEMVESCIPGFPEYAIKVLQFRPDVYRNFVNSLYLFAPRAKAFNEYKKSFQSPFLDRLLGLSPGKEQADGIARLEEPPYTIEWIEAVMKKKADSEKVFDKQKTSITKDYLEKTDGQIAFKDPFDKEAANAVPELSGQVNLNKLLKGL